MLYFVAANSIVMHGRTNSTVDEYAHLACYVECVIVAVELKLDQAAYTGAYGEVVFLPHKTFQFVARPLC